MKKSRWKSWISSVGGLREKLAAAGKLFDVLLIASIVASVLIVMLSTVRSIDAQYFIVEGDLAGSLFIDRLLAAFAKVGKQHGAI